MHKPAGAQFLGDGSRLAVQKVLGRGASGTVYRVYDRARSANVAVKVLSHVDPAALFRFKSEFRTLSDLTHPNLLQLYELVLSGEQWLLTMELVEGRDFLHFVRPGERSADAATEGAPESKTLADIHDTEDIAAAQAVAEPALAQPESAQRPADEALRVDLARLRDALAQLCEGLQALHRSGRLHRDLKPANVLVHDGDGRLVICDFGLALETGGSSKSVRGKTHLEHRSTGSYTGSSSAIVGTVAYMSPEQALGLPLNEASDWYAVGVMLYQALTGRTPFDGKLPYRAAVAAKLLQTPTHPCEINSSLPIELSQLALALLSPIPAFRPGYREIMLELGVRPAEKPPRTSIPSLLAEKGERLIGREPELFALHQALRGVHTSGASLMFVAGHSGMGKSALVDVFLDDAENAGCLVLSGRCYEREQLPYKAFDPLVDALSTYLLRLDDRAVLDLLPAGIQELKQLFPVLERVPTIQALAAEERARVDAFDVRREAFGALRELLRRLSLSKPLVLYIDDLQWGDLESAPLFLELLRPPQPPSILMICSFRSEEEEQSPLLTLLRGGYLAEAQVAAPGFLEVGPLSEQHCRELAVSLLAGVEGADALADRIAREAGGNPFLVTELATHVRANDGLSPEGVSIDAVMDARLEALPEESFRLLSMIAVADRPEPVPVIQLATQLEGSFLAALSYLESQRLVRTGGANTADRVDVFHTYVRDAVYRKLEEGARRRAHRRLAEAIENTSPSDLEALFRHWHGAGERGHAAHYAVRAATAAEASLAHARAAELLLSAVELSSPDDPKRAELVERRAHALMCAGRGVEAAQEFFAALQFAPPDRALQLRGLAITQLLRCGQVSAAFEELRRAEELIGLPVPRTDAQAQRMLWWRQLRLWMQGDRFQVRTDATLDPALHGRMSMLWAVSSSLSSVDLLRGGLYQAELTRLARLSGDPYHLACALSLATLSVAASGNHAGHVDELYERGLQMAGLSGSAHALSAVKGMMGVARLHQGRFMEAQRLTREARALLQERVTPALAWDRVALVFFELQALAQLGRMEELREGVLEAVRESEGRGDLLASTLFRGLRCSWAHLSADEPELAQEASLRAERDWQHPGYSQQHYYITHALSEVALYTRQDLEAALARVEREWEPSAFVRKTQHSRVELLWTRARLALALCERDATAPRLLWARSAAAELQHEGVPWASAIGQLLEASSCTRDERKRALLLLRQCAGLFEATDMKLMSVVARARAAQLGEGAESARELKLQWAELESLGVLKPERFVEMLAPGFAQLR